MTPFKLALYIPEQFGVFSIAGPDAERYLHGRITQDVKKLSIGSAARSLVLTPQGRMQGQFSIFKRGANDFLIASDPLADAPAADDLLSALLQFKVADQLTGAKAVGLTHFYLIGADSAAVAAESAEKSGGVFFRRDLGSVPAVEGIVENISALKGAVSTAGGEEIDRGTFERLTVIEGVALFGRDLTEKTLAPEIEVTPLVSFNKGCYAGQEVVEMATARGRANRKLCRLKAAGSKGISPGNEVFPVTDQSKAAGVVTSAAFDSDSDSTYALAFCKAADGVELEYLIGGSKFIVID